MALVNLKSGVITNRDASPKVLSNGNIAGGQLYSAIATIEVGATDAATSTYKFFSIPSNAVVQRLLLYMDVMDSGATTFAIDVGLYDTTANGGLVVDADFFASAVVGLVTAINGTKIGTEADDIANGEKMIWEHSSLSLTVDPKKMYDVVATSTGDADTAGTVTLKIFYTV